VYRDPQRSDPLLRWVATLIAVAPLAVPTGLVAQTVRMTSPDNFRVEPNQAVIATLESGTELTWVQTLDTWIEADLEGWVWTQSLQATDREGFDLVVAESAGENLRDRPQGDVLARLEEGTLLEELERIPGWILVRRRGFLWAASAAVDESSVASASLPSMRDTSPPPTEGASVASPSTAGTARFSVEPGTVVRTAPDGDSLLTVGEDARVAVVGSEGGWARVLVEGWVRVPEGATVDAQPEPAATLPVGPAPTDVAANPTGAVGAIVSWELQFISLERATELRPEFDPGEPYLLMRPTGEGTGRFVYVAIPEENAQAAENFVPLERFTVRGRIRTGASAVSGAPVLDLVEMTRRR